MKPIKPFSAIFMVLVLAACAQTTATKTTPPRQEETRQTPPADSEASSETSESGQPESPVKSKSAEQTATEEAAGGEKKPRPATAVESETESHKLEPKSSTSQASQEDSAEAKLAQAREILRISRETEKRIAAELAQLKESGHASEEAVKDYETYLKSVAAMTAENRKIVEQMETAYAKKSSGKTGSNELDKMADPDIPEEHATDEVAALDSQLNASLAKFDGLLLEEMDEIRAGSSGKLQDLAAEAAEAAKRLREKGLDVDTSGSKSSDGSPEKREGRKGTEKASKDNSGKGGQGPSSTNQRRRDYEDDDIVARQLREAAENETDPELKEKLWKEYEEYKKSK
jgi:hypothetical protein